MIPNEVILDDRIDPISLAIYCYLNCRKDGWKFYSKDIAKRIKRKDPTTVRKYMKNLKECGYIDIKQKKVGGKFIGNEYIILEIDRSGKNPLREKSTTEKTRYGKNPQDSNTRPLSNTILNNNTKEEEGSEEKLNKSILDEYKDAAIKETRFIEMLIQNMYLSKEWVLSQLSVYTNEAIGFDKTINDYTHFKHSFRNWIQRQDNIRGMRQMKKDLFEAKTYQEHISILEKQYPQLLKFNKQFQQHEWNVWEQYKKQKANGSKIALRKALSKLQTGEHKGTLLTAVGQYI